MRISSTQSTTGDRQSGIALLVVMVVFVVLYLVVYHLRYWVAMEEHIARVRQGEMQSYDALRSGALASLVMLQKDLQEDMMETAAGGIAMGMGAAGGVGPGSGHRELQDLQLPQGMQPGDERGGGSNFVPLQASPQGAVSHHDHLNETLFLDSGSETLGEVEFRYRIRDGEGRFSLNRLFEYADARMRHIEGKMAAALEEGGEEVDGDDPDALEEEEEGRGRRRGRRPAGEAEGLDPEMERQLGLADEGDLSRFVEPDPRVIEDTREMLRRAILVVISMNEARGYEYRELYSAGEVADGIVEYVLARRRSPTQNVIYQTSELLNVYTVTPELYYGPVPEIPEEGLLVDGFLLTRDTFGDLHAEFVEYDNEELMYMEEQQQLLEELQETYGRFASFPGLGGLMGDPMTRGMSRPPIVYDEETDREYLLKPPLPLGLRDIFCVFSSGKININTAPVAVIYGLLLSLSEGFAERLPTPQRGEANYVAVAIDDYRNGLVEEVEEEDPTGTGRSDERGGILAEDEPIDPLDPSILEGESAYEDVDTNFFRSLQEIEVVDGTEGGPEDILQAGVGVDLVSGGAESVFQRMLDDLTAVAAFGSTYFTVEIKARSQKSPLVKTGHLVVKRDVNTRMMEVMLWKEVE